MENQQIFNELTEIRRAIEEQNTLLKPVLNFDEACRYLELSRSHMYKLTSKREIPHFCPNGKKLYFKREELDNWLQRNRKNTNDEIEQKAIHLTRNKGKAF